MRKKLLALFLTPLLMAGAVDAQVIGGQVHHGGGNSIPCTNCMITPLLASTSSPVTGNATTYLPPLGGVLGSSGGQVNGIVFPISGKISNLQVQFPTAVVANYYTINVMLNNVLSPLQCSIGQGGVNLGTTTKCSDTTDVINIAAAGDFVSIQIAIPGGTATGQAPGVTVGMTFLSANGQESFIGFGNQIKPLSTVINYYGFPNGGSVTEAAASSIMPTAGILDQLAASIGSTFVQGSWQFTLFKNGVATNIAVTCLPQTLACFDYNDSVSVAAGDTISIQACPSGVTGCQPGPTNGDNRYWAMSLRFVPQAANQSVLFNVPNTLPVSTTTAARFLFATGASSNATADTGSQNIVPATMTLGNLIIGQCPGPGIGVTRPFALRDNGVSQAPIVTVPSGATACPALTIQQDTVDTYQAGSGTLLGLLTYINTVAGANSLTELKTAMTVTVP